MVVIVAAISRANVSAEIIFMMGCDDDLVFDFDRSSCDNI